MFLLLNLLVIVVLYGAILPAVILGLAGRWNLWYVWGYAGVSVFSLAFQALVIYRECLKEWAKTSLATEFTEFSEKELKGLCG